MADNNNTDADICDLNVYSPWRGATVCRYDKLLLLPGYIHCLVVRQSDRRTNMTDHWKTSSSFRGSADADLI